MKHKETHQAIKLKFNLHQTQNDNLPHVSNRGTRYDLAEMFRELGFTKGAEIGTRVGKYAEYLCKVNPGLHLSCIDPWDNYHPKYPLEKQERYYEEAKARLAPYSVTLIRKTSNDALADFADESLDFVFIDGNHEFDYACPDIIFWSRKVRSGGIVSVHDYYHFRWAGVVEAVDAYTKCHMINPWYGTKEREPTAFWVKP